MFLRVSDFVFGLRAVLLFMRLRFFLLLLGHVQGVIDVCQIEQKVDCDSVSLRFCYIRLATETA